MAGPRVHDAIASRRSFVGLEAEQDDGHLRPPRRATVADVVAGRRSLPPRTMVVAARTGALAARRLHRRPVGRSHRTAGTYRYHRRPAGLRRGLLVRHQGDWTGPPALGRVGAARPGAQLDPGARHIAPPWRRGPASGPGLPVCR